MLSIITPVLNGASFIKSNIDSIKKLDFPFEHIIVDGGSLDGTLEIVVKYPHLKIINQNENSGMYGAIHQGILESRGNLIAWVNADDLIIADGYKLLYNIASKNKLDLVYGDGICHFKETYKYQFVSGLPFARYFLRQGIFPFVQPSAIFSRNAYFKVGGFNFLKFRIIGDRDLFQRMAYDNSIKFFRINCLASVFLIYSGSLLNSNLELLNKEHNHTIKTNPSLANRVLYHGFRLIGRIRNLF
jgi:glycosyltransferase involved in cell wall biosynthesis